MSDFRFPGRWLTDRRVMTLSGDEFKSFVTAGAWMVENRTDGLIGPDDLEFIPRFTRESIPAFVAAGLWIEDTDRWLWVMTDYQSTQTSRAEFEVLENARRRDREKKARQRSNPQPQPVPGDVPGDKSRGTTQARPGRPGRPGQAEDLVPDEAISWPTATPGAPDEWTSPTAPGSILSHASSDALMPDGTVF